MSAITQDIRYKQAIIEYSMKHGVTNAAIRCKAAGRISTAGGRNTAETFIHRRTALKKPPRRSDMPRYGSFPYIAAALVADPRIERRSSIFTYLLILINGTEALRPPLSCMLHRARRLCRSCHLLFPVRSPRPQRRGRTRSARHRRSGCRSSPPASPPHGRGR